MFDDRGGVGAVGGTARAAGCRVLHVDMDAFFASVEVRRRPELAGTPVIVGGAGNRGVVTSATYEARRYGVHAAMPTARALRLCPTATVLPGDMALYAEVSRSVMALFRSITPLVEPLSMDEAFLDVSGAGRRLGDAAEIGEYIRARVFDEQGITCSVGVAATKFVAKLASTARQARRACCVVRPAEVIDFLHPLPVGALWGVGPEDRGDAAAAGPAHRRRPRPRAGADPAAGARRRRRQRTCTSWPGGATRAGWSPTSRRSRPGAEETFGTDVDDPAVIHRELLRLAERTAGRLRSAGHLARTVSIKVRFADFATITRSRTLDVPTDVGQELYDTARALFDALGLDRARIRLVGVRAERLVDAGTASPSSWSSGAREHGRREAELAADRAARRFGAGAVRPATLLQRAGRPGRDAGRGRRADRPSRRIPERVIARGSDEDPDRRAAGSPFAACEGLVSSVSPSAGCHRRPLAACAHLEVDVPLSEHEQRLLEQIERALVDDDPKFASTVRTGDRRLRARRRLQLGGAARRRRPRRAGRGAVYSVVPSACSASSSCSAGRSLGVLNYKTATGAVEAGSAPPAAAARPPAGRAGRGSRAAASR